MQRVVKWSGQVEWSSEMGKHDDPKTTKTGKPMFSSPLRSAPAQRQTRRRSTLRCAAIRSPVVRMEASPVKATDYLAIAAFLVSLTSLGFSIYFGFLDRSRLKASSQYYPEWEHSSAHITVSAVNHGRRPIILTLLGGTYEDGNWEGTSLGKDRAGLRLDENERFQETIRSGHDM